MDVVFHEKELFYTPSTTDSSLQGENQDEVLYLEDLHTFFPSNSASPTNQTAGDEDIWTPTIAETNPLHDSTLSPNTSTDPLSQSSPENPLEVHSNPTLVDDNINLESQSSQYHLPPRFNRGIPPIRYEPDPKTKVRYPISDHMSSQKLSKSYASYVLQLSSVSIPSKMQEALADDRWTNAMAEEMAALEKNATWELVHLPKGKKTVGCRWNFGYKQSNSDHTLFLKHRKGKITALIIYVDDMVVTGDDHDEIDCLQRHLTSEFEMKQLGDLKYFLGIEVARSKHGIFLSQRKYILDLLTETGMLGCKPVDTPIEQNHKLFHCLDATSTDKGRYQRLVGKLIYLSHTRPDIAYAVCVVSQFMHDPRKPHMDAVERILRYLKSAPGKGLLFTKHNHLKIEGYTDAD
ncbi:hypothetical protein UlMin_041118 [Ulmus minor]